MSEEQERLKTHLAFTEDGIMILRWALPNGIVIEYTPESQDVTVIENGEVREGSLGGMITRLWYASVPMKHRVRVSDEVNRLRTVYDIAVMTRTGIKANPFVTQEDAERVDREAEEAFLELYEAIEIEAANL